MIWWRKVELISIELDDSNLPSLEDLVGFLVQ
jgi:hypothetical protein